MKGITYIIFIAIFGVVYGTQCPEPPSKECILGLANITDCCVGYPRWMNILIKNIYNCETYYICMEDAPFLQFCPEGLVYNVELQRCDTPENSHCEVITTPGPEITSTVQSTTSSTPTEGPNDDCLLGLKSKEECCKGVPYWKDVLLKNPKDCNTYYQCVHEVPVLRPCPAGLHWSVARNRCEWPSIAGCETTSTPVGGNNTTENPITTSTSHGSSTQNGNSTTPAANTTTTNPISTTAEEPISTTTEEPISTTESNQGSSSTEHGGSGGTTNCPPTTPEIPMDDCLNGVLDPNLCCKGVPYWKDVLLKNPEDCGTYYQCVHEVPVLRPCPAGLHWSVARNRCEWPSIAGCDTSSTPGGGNNTTENPITTSTSHGSSTQNGNSTTPAANTTTANPISTTTEEPISTTTEEPISTTESNQGSSSTEHGGSGETTNSPSTTPEIPMDDCLNGVIDPKLCCKGVPYWKDVLLKNPEDCGTYYQCVHEVPVLRPCPAGLHWSVARNRCEWPSIAGCDISSTPGGGNNTTENPITTSTSHGSSTQNGNLTTPATNPTTSNPNSSTTEEPISTTESNQGSSSTEHGGSGETTNSPPTTPEIPMDDCLNGVIDPKLCCKGVPYWKDVLLKNPENCGTYYQCVHEVPVLRPCPAGLHWSVARNRCEWPSIAGCETTSTPSGGNNTTENPITTSTSHGSSTQNGNSTTSVTNTPGGGNNTTENPITTSTSHGSSTQNGNSTTPAENITTANPISTTTEEPISTTTEEPISTTESNQGSSSTEHGGSGGTTNCPPTTPEIPMDDCLNGVLDPNLCCKGVPYWKDVLLKNPEDCGTYYQCVHEVPVLRPCPAGLHWSVARNRCEWPSIAGCDTSSTPSGGNNTTENPITTSTSHGSSTQNGNSTTPATNTTTSNPNSSTTEEPISTTESNQGSSSTEHGGSGETTNSPPTTPEIPMDDCLNGVIDPKLCCKGVPYWKDVLLKNPEDCGTYYQCVHEVPVLRPCPVGLHWSVARNRCEWPSIAGCDTTSTPGGGNNTTENPITTSTSHGSSTQNGNLTTPATNTTTSNPNSSTTEKPISTTESSNQGSSSTEHGGSGGTTNCPPTTPEIPTDDCLNGIIDPKLCCKGVPYWKDVLLKNPEDCGTYYQCVHEEPVLRPCPAGLHWSIAANRCEWPQIAKCLR